MTSKPGPEDSGRRDWREFWFEHSNCGGTWVYVKDEKYPRVTCTCGTLLNENIEAFEREVDLSNSILRRNRYNTTPPYQWYGPNPEPKERPPTLRTDEEDTIVEWDIDANLPLYTRDYLRRNDGTDSWA